VHPSPQARIDAGEDVVVGVNKYRIPAGQAEAVDVLRIDNTTVLQSQIQGKRTLLPQSRGSPLLNTVLLFASQASAT
jgi:methylmalonyl-CoA mutase N-terminal domain/subunit